MNAGMTGMLATSKAGHDKDTVYIIVKEENEYVYVSDGRLKTLENPKKKNKKHIQIIKKEADDMLREKLINGQHIYNEEIRKAIGGFICQRQM
ncbi:MAG: hypothetical protein HFI04_11025 [Lachnospiraceae bacterium]|jgi:ribosomal protein L14E/L6E/L27E|nr:hypothetical protein [Lachnospiraceae bacterium]